MNLLSAHESRWPVLLRMQLVPPRETKISGASRYLDDLEAAPFFVEADLIVDSSDCKVGDTILRRDLLPAA